MSVCLCAVAAATLVGFPAAVQAASFNSFGLKVYTIDSPHFRVHYHKGTQRIAERTAAILEELYDIYRDTYHITLPEKTEVLIVDDIRGNAWAMDLLNIILISTNGMDFNLRGTHDWLRDAVTHEFAHVISITTSHKFPSAVPYAQIGYFSHPNNSRTLSDGGRVGLRTEAMHILPSEILPPWFFEGIAQYESSQRGSDKWDSHRDMILRSLVLSDKLLPWDHMSVFAGKGDDFEKTYNHGFSLVKYIDETYGYGKVVSILRESSRFGRLNFDRSIKRVLGISGRQLYREWKQHLHRHYSEQLKGLGDQVYGRKINEEGYDNRWPRFSPGEHKIYFASNGENDYSFRSLYSYSLSDTVEDDKRIKVETGAIKGFYSIHDQSGLVAYVSGKSRKSAMPLNEGGHRSVDVFIDTLPPEEKKFRPFKKKTQRQVTEKKHIFHAVFSPSGDMMACTQRRLDRFFLCLTDTAGDNFLPVYPDSTDAAQAIQTMYSLDWSADGRRIAISYFDTENRKIGVYDTLEKEFRVLCDSEHDERDPRFSHDGKHLYFTSNRTGIFNVYRYSFETGKLQRLTNVSGGAFAPDASEDENRLVYSNYDKDGYGIYLIDTVRVLQEFAPVDSFLVLRGDTPQEPLSASTTAPRPYSLLPRKFLLIPTMYWEEAVTEDDDPYRGRGAFKIGAVANLLDPYALASLGSPFLTGNELGAYLLLDATKLTRFINPDMGFISPAVDYDLGAFGTTNMLPVSIRLSYMQRGITGRDIFFDEIEGVHQVLDYNVTPYSGDMVIPFYWQRGGFQYGQLVPLLALYLHGALNRTDVTLLLRDLYGITLQYNIQKGAKAGLFFAFQGVKAEPTWSICPRGKYLKILYNFEQQLLIDDENSFNESMQENYNTFTYNRVKIDFKAGVSTPWYKKHVFYLEMGGSATDLIHTAGTDSKRFPYYYEPEIWWHPGYAYYTRENSVQEKTLTRQDSSGTVFYDTLVSQPYYKGVVGGDAVTFGTFSYRFPLWPGSINKKVGFVYLDRLYGGVNFTGGAGWADLAGLVDIGKWSRDDWLLSTGAELRLEGQTFNRYPLAVRLKWDYGFDRPAPVGGHRFTLGVGFGFDNWEYIEIPEYRAPGLATR